MSALPVPSPERPARGGRKPIRSANSPRTKKQAASAEPSKRGFAGKRFVGFETDFLEAIYRHASSLSELKLILLVAKMANDREVGNPFGRTAAILPIAIADEIGCSTQNIRCSASVWFYDDDVAKAGQPTGLIERFERKTRGAAARKSDGDMRAFELQIRADYVATWTKQREESRRRAEDLKREQEAARQAALIAATENDGKRRRSWKSTAPVRVGPKAPFKLPDEARELVRENCTAITAKRDGTIKDLRITAKGVLEFDFDPAPAAAVEPSSPPQKTAKIRKSTCAFPNTSIANKGLTERDTRKYAPIDDAEPTVTNPAVADLRAGLDRKLIDKIGAPVSAADFREVVAQLGGADAINEARIAAVIAAVQVSVRKIRNWKYLISPSPVTGKSIIQTVRIAEERRAELGPGDEDTADTEVEDPNVREVRRMLERGRATQGGDRG